MEQWCAECCLRYKQRYKRRRKRHQSTAKLKPPVTLSTLDLTKCTVERGDFEGWSGLVCPDGTYQVLPALHFLVQEWYILFHCEHRHIDFLATDPQVCEDTSFWIGHTKKKRCNGSKLQALFFSRLILAMPGFWEFFACPLLASSSSRLHKWNKHCNDDHQHHENKTKLNAQIDFQNI